MAAGRVVQGYASGELARSLAVGCRDSARGGASMLRLSRVCFLPAQGCFSVWLRAVFLSGSGLLPIGSGLLAFFNGSLCLVFAEEGVELSEGEGVVETFEGVFI